MARFDSGRVHYGHRQPYSSTEEVNIMREVRVLEFREKTTHPEAIEVKVFSERMADKVQEALENQGFELKHRLKLD